MFGILASAVYAFFEKRIKNKAVITCCYFAAVGLIWAIVTFCVAGLTIGRKIILGEVDSGILLLTPLVGFILGLFFAFFPWILGLHNSDEEKETK